MKRIGVAILGGTGFGAGELLRLLSHHPDVSVVSVASSSKAGSRLDVVHPHLRGFYSLTLDSGIDIERLSQFSHRVLFSALPHGASGDTIADLAPQCVAQGIRIIDLSGDLRLKDTTLHTQWYPHSSPHPDLRSSAVYGLTELYREQISLASIISNPGCLATASILALAPLACLGRDDRTILNLTTGSSGSGRELKEATHHPTRHSNVTAYKPLHHQHVPEIRQALAGLGGEPFELSFVPHSLPIARGIFGTAYVALHRQIPESELRATYQRFFSSSPFIRVLPHGQPELQNVVASNFTDIAVTSNARNVAITIALDNLVKGMAGQAIQNMNLMCGLPETTGLWFPSARPV